ncbi:MAG: hypothetical protein GXY77_19540 [Fibrobacter sp.]|nr:hypothetical protein [Fibrobacter sp.]
MAPHAVIVVMVVVTIQKKVPVKAHTRKECIENGVTSVGQLAIFEIMADAAMPRNIRVTLPGLYTIAFSFGVFSTNYRIG